ncbi:MAG: hypothetical protein ACYS0I_20450 [Planctomycetota bacterium]|jgi:hypothetical protein
MPIVDGRYEAKISTTFQSTISNVPMGLLEKLMPLFKGKDVKIILPTKEKPTSELKEIGEVAVQKAKIYKDYKGIKANLGSIYFADRIFSVAWDKGKILEIDAMDYDKCVKCMKNMFDVGWRYAEK